MSGPLASRRNSDVVLPVIQLRPYQQHWIDDDARARIAVKSARIGYSYATGVRAILQALKQPGSTRTVLSASKPQSIEFIEQMAKNIEAIGATAQIYQEPFADEFGLTEITQSRVQFANGARVIALPANPRTARGYPGNAILDEFGHQEDSYSIWAAVIRQIALGNEIDVVSTPNGEQGKFFDLVKELGLHEGVAPASNPMRKGIWSGHWVDIYLAVAEGCPIDIAQMRELIKDEDTFQQEFCCVFLKAAGSWIPMDMILKAEDDGAWINIPSDYVPAGLLYAGIDVARERDKTVMWMDEVIGDVAWTRMVLPLHATTFPKQHELLTPWVEKTTRTAIDSTGMGIALYDYLDASCRGRVMGINFAGNTDAGVKMKTDLAIRIKRNLELGRSRIPHDPQIRQAFLAIKRESTASGVKFDAPRIQVDSAVAGGKKKKMWGHADEFWAKALADFAAAGSPAGALANVEVPESAYRSVRRGQILREANPLADKMAKIRDGFVEKDEPLMPRERKTRWA